MSKTSHKTTAPRGGTAVGSTFWKRWLNCKWKWFLVYVLGVSVRPVDEAAKLAAKSPTAIGGVSPLMNPLEFGSAYHEAHEFKGKVKSAHLKEYAEEAERLYKARMQPLAPPMAEPTGHEVPYEHETLPYTTRIDREEGDIAREFKTAKKIYDNDEARWKVNLEILGELVLSRKRAVIVDIITKEVAPRSKQIEVTLDDVRREAFEILIEDAADDLRARLAQFDMSKTRGGRAFPRNMESCVLFTQCEFYNYCWGTDLERTVGYVKGKAPTNWRKKLLGGK